MKWFKKKDQKPEYIYQPLNANEIRKEFHSGVWVVRKGNECTTFLYEIAALRAAVTLKADVEFWEYGYTKFIEGKEGSTHHPYIVYTSKRIQDRDVLDISNDELNSQYFYHFYSRADNYCVWSTANLNAEAQRKILHCFKEKGAHIGSIILDDLLFDAKYVVKFYPGV